jgi:hypothetical protein
MNATPGEQPRSQKTELAIAIANGTSIAAGTVPNLFLRV